MMKRRGGFRRQSRGAGRPSREWFSLNTGWTLSAVTATTATRLLSLQAPTSLDLTSDPPEDMTVLRIVGQYALVLTGVAASWTLALLVQDTDWTPTAGASGFSSDADKRILWNRTYVDRATSGGSSWDPPGVLTSQGSVLPAPSDQVTIDIAPKVKVEAGKALYLVGYENSGTGTLTTVSWTVRMLVQRTGRR